MVYLISAKYKFLTNLVTYLFIATCKRQYVYVYFLQIFFLISTAQEDLVALTKLLQIEDKYEKLNRGFMSIEQKYLMVHDRLVDLSNTSHLSTCKFSSILLGNFLL